LTILEVDSSSVVETAFDPTLTGFTIGFDGAGVICSLPVLGTASCFMNWLFQKSSFFIWELNSFPFVVVRKILPRPQRVILLTVLLP